MQRVCIDCYETKWVARGLRCNHCVYLRRKLSKSHYFNRESERIRTSRHGLKPVDITTMLDKQDGKCAICHNDIGRSAHIDHDHNNGKVRGLLCVNCNRGLGFFKDNPEFLVNATLYILENNE